MTSDLVLRVKTREKTAKRDDKTMGMIPGILYGREVENVMLWLNRREFNRIYEESGESTIFKLSLENGEQRNVLIKDIQRDILNGKPVHIDFYQVRMDEKIETSVELEFVGESPLVKETGGVLIKNMDAVDVKCLPGDLPPAIEVDISRIKNFEDYIYVKDLPISSKVELMSDPENVVAMVTPPRSEEELAELETEVKEDVTQVEGVEKEEKEAQPAEETKEQEEPKGKKE